MQTEELALSGDGEAVTLLVQSEESSLEPTRRTWGIVRAQL